MSGQRISAISVQAAAVGLPATVYSISDYLYLAMCGQGFNLELTDKTIDYFDEGNNPRLSPDGTLIVLDANFPAFWTPPSPPAPGFDSGAILTVPVEGGTPTLISPYDEGGPYMLHPSWHPNSQKVVYIHAGPTTGFEGKIVEVDLANPGVETVLYDLGTDPDSAPPFRPKYSPDGTKITFWVNVAANPDTSLDGLWIMDADGSNLTQIFQCGATTGGRGYLFDGDGYEWSPDGTRIVLHDQGYDTPSPGGGTQPIWIIDPDGSNAVQISIGDTDTNPSFATGVPKRLSFGAWAPDGSYVIGAAMWTDGIATFKWLPWRYEIDGTTPETVLQTAVGIDGDDPDSNVCWFWKGRVWFYEDAEVGILSSILPDGSGYRVETDLGTDLDGDKWYLGSGVDWI